MTLPIEEWNDGGFTGTIKKYDLEPKAAKEPVELWDEYDERLKGEPIWKDWM